MDIEFIMLCIASGGIIISSGIIIIAFLLCRADLLERRATQEQEERDRERGVWPYNYVSDTEREDFKE